MLFSFTRRLRLLTLSAALLVVHAPAQAEFTGMDWQDSSADLKRGVMIGALTIVQAERAFAGADNHCASAEPTLERGLGHMTVPQLQQALDDYYKAKPDQRNRSIMHAIWALALQQNN